VEQVGFKSRVRSEEVTESKSEYKDRDELISVEDEVKRGRRV